MPVKQTDSLSDAVAFLSNYEQYEYILGFIKECRETKILLLEKNLEANMDYEVHAIAMPDPKNQSLVHLGYEVQLSDSSIEEFRMTADLKTQLEIFQCPSENK